MENRNCNKCFTEKEITLFGKDKKSLTGYGRVCRDCLALKQKKHRAANREVTNNTVAKYRANNPDKIKATNLAQYSMNREKRCADSRKWHHDNREHVMSRMKAYSKANRHIFNALVARRKAAKVKATPVWANQSAIVLIYAKSRRISKWLEVTQHVDHIVPILSKFVCGLHCEANLRIIPGVENCSKKNLWWPDMW